LFVIQDIDLGNKMSTADKSRGMNVSVCKWPWTFRSCPSYAFVSVLAALKKMHFTGYLRVILFQKPLYFCDY